MKSYVNDMIVTDPNGEKAILYPNTKQEAVEGLSERLSRLFIQNVATGENIYIADSSDDNVIELAVYGKSTQGENPSPENQQEVISSVVSEIKTNGKNLVSYPHFETSHVDNGITWTDLGDGRVMANGTATANSVYFLQRHYDGLEEGESYILSGCPKNGGTDSWLFRVADDTNTNNIMASDYGDGRTFTYTKDSGEVRIYLRITSGVTVNNMIFEPMLRKADIVDATFEPYKESVVTFSQPIELRGIEVTSTDDYTYEKDGKYYVADTIEKINGEYKKVQRIVESNGQNLSWSLSTTYIGSVNTRDLVGVIKYDVPVLCTHTEWIKYSLTNYVYGKAIVSGAGQVNFYLKNEAFSDANEVKTWMLENDFYFQYALLEPIITPLPTADQIALGNLKTFYPITNVSNNANAEMKLKYYADTKNYIDGKIATLEMALVNSI